MQLRKHASKPQRFTPAERESILDWLDKYRIGAVSAMESAERAKRVDGAGTWAEGTRKYYLLMIKVLDFLKSHVDD